MTASRSLLAVVLHYLDLVDAEDRADAGKSADPSQRRTGIDKPEPAAGRAAAAGGGDQDGQPGAVAKANPGAVQAEVLVLRVLEAPQRIGQLWRRRRRVPQPQS